MGMLPSPSRFKPDYGIDAPGVVRGFVLAGGAAVVAAFLLWRLSDSLPEFWRHIASLLFWPGMTFLLTGLAMIWGSKFGKLRYRKRLIDQLKLQGQEQVLDVGCGRGLMLLGLARQLTTGRAVGIDLWRTQDQSGNAITTTEENARREGVAERVELHTGEMCHLPFDDNRFDVVVSSWAVHNIPSQAGRKEAISEMARVLKPQGRLVLVDISYTGEYVKALTELGWANIQHRGPSLMFVIPSNELWASKP